MSTLNGILAELGIAEPKMHPERDITQHTDWIVDRPFEPEVGRCYEVAYGKVFVHGVLSHMTVRLRIDGPHPSQWVDLDEDEPLDPALHPYPVKAYRPIESDE